jgi:hypothetical protein
MTLSPYTARSLKATALLEETRTLLRAWNPGETAVELRKRARNDDLLCKATASRRDDIVQAAFIARLLAHGQEPAASLRALLDRRGNGPWFEQLCLLFASRADVVLFEAVTDFVRGARERHAETVTTPEFVRYLHTKQDQGRMPQPWSDNVRQRVARHVLHQLTDFRVLGPPQRGVRPILRYRPGSLATVWLACELHLRGVSDGAIIDHPDWQAWQLPDHELRDVLARLSDLGLWVYQGAGSVVRITWTWSDWSTVLDVLGGPCVD